MRSSAGSTRLRISSFCAARSVSFILMARTSRVTAHKTAQTRRMPRDQRVRRYITRDQRACSDQSALADFDTAHHDRAAPDRGPAPDDGRLEPPVSFLLGRAVGIGRARKAIVDEHHAVADEHLIFDNDAGADEAVARDFAAPADRRAPLDLDERADARVGADLAAVQIDERT